MLRLYRIHSVHRNHMYLPMLLSRCRRRTQKRPFNCTPHVTPKILATFVAAPQGCTVNVLSEGPQ